MLFTKFENYEIIKSLISGWMEAWQGTVMSGS